MLAIVALPGFGVGVALGLKIVDGLTIESFGVGVGVGVGLTQVTETLTLALTGPCRTRKASVSMPACAAVTVIESVTVSSAGDSGIVPTVQGVIEGEPPTTRAN